jgi:glycosyltransferase involved in cell wall biosynthesis
MMTNPLVSTVIIFFNGERFIEEAIESVFAQTYDHWELLLVDDGSTDGSTAIARRYAERSPAKVQYLEHENHQNRGMSASRNWGVKHGKGKYIALLDADDVWFPQKLEQQVAILNSRPEAAMLYGRTQIWYGWTGAREDRERDQLLDLGVQPDSLVKPPTLFFLLLQGGNVQTPTTCNVLIRRDAFEQVGGFQEAFRGMYEDQAFFVKLCLNAPVYVANECWARYRQHSDGCCSIAQRTGEADRAWLPFLNWIATYLTEQGMKGTNAWKGLQQAMWPHRYPALYRFQKQTRRALGYGQLRLSRVAQRVLPAPAYHLLQRARQAVIRLTTSNLKI